MHTLQLRLKTTAYDRQEITRRFYALSHIHNVLVKHAKKLLCQLEHNKEYQGMLTEYRTLSKIKEPTKESDSRKDALLQEMSSFRQRIGLTEAGLQSYIKVCGKRYKKLLSSQQVQKEASNVWRGVEKVLFGNGKQLHFKKNRDFTTISGKTNTNGAKFDKETLTVNWLGLSMLCKLPKREKDRQYIEASLSSDISYCQIHRKMFSTGWRYYVILVLSGDAPKKLQHIGDSTMGIDPGTSTIAGVSETKVILTELAPETKQYEKAIYRLQQSMDRSKRAMNPKKYKPDGTINKQNHDPWRFSHTYRKNRDRLKSLYRKKSAYIKQSHEILCNTLLADSRHFLVEKMNYAGLQKRSKHTARQEHLSEVKKKDGSTRKIYKYKRKKRFGRSLGSRAPAMFLHILQQKVQLYNGSYREINTRTFCASQYDHVENKNKKTPLSQRTKIIGGVKVQRDLYSAFLISNATNDLSHANRRKCNKKFADFIVMQEKEITRMKASGSSMKQCFGF